ncbi:J-domain-containing protein [Pseudonocardia sp. HH130630-07]|uniref:DnaJ family domain-containing protein n=1 Tax=Pseudonocardia sp. HH130630-07 TaxID=1690815 RepID=UPI000814DD89|nr:DUF1992 domain-containing protein [Pseudonocardia sp. HH130630-07]ANY10840.1 hypothetical protein AFB00_31095 [Pseudonocardia sp. HH130630-07]
MSEAYWEKYRSIVDRQIEQSGLSEGLGDNPYRGKPLADAGKRYHENWWIDGYVHREGITGDAHLPISLRLRREIEQIGDAVAGRRSESEVRELLDDLNERITEWRRVPTPPHVSLSTVDVDDVVQRWHASRTSQQGGTHGGNTGPDDSNPGEGGPPPRRRGGGRTLFDRLLGRNTD